MIALPTAYHLVEVKHLLCRMSSKSLFRHGLDFLRHIVLNLTEKFQDFLDFEVFVLYLTA